MIIRTRRKITGNALTQYGIIIVLIALALVPVFFFTGKYIVNYFDSFYQSIKNNNNTTGNNPDKNNSPASTPDVAVVIPVAIADNDIINGNVKAGELGGTSDKPVSKCAGDVCTVDYGDFVLNGIPADFSELVQSSGTSGGTDNLLALIDQMLEQAKTFNPPIDSAYIRELSNRGHKIAEYQKNIETAIIQMSEAKTLNTAGILQDRIGNNITNARFALDDFNKQRANLFQTLPNPSKEQLNLLKTIDYLSIQIESLQNSMDVTAVDFNSKIHSDIVSKESISTPSESYVLPSNIIYQQNQVPDKTNIKSGIICYTGHGNDTGVNCN